MEALLWTAGLLLVAALDPGGDPDGTICPFHWISRLVGVEFCPGCGLGRAVGLLARGNLRESLAMHPLAVPAVGVLVTHAARLYRDAVGGPKASSSADDAAWPNVI